MFALPVRGLFELPTAGVAATRRLIGSFVSASHVFNNVISSPTFRDFLFTSTGKDNALADLGKIPVTGRYTMRAVTSSSSSTQCTKVSGFTSFSFDMGLMYNVLPIGDKPFTSNVLLGTASVTVSFLLPSA